MDHFRPLVFQRIYNGPKQAAVRVGGSDDNDFFHAVPLYCVPLQISISVTKNYVQQNLLRGRVIDMLLIEKVRRKSCNTGNHMTDQYCKPNSI